MPEPQPVKEVPQQTRNQWLWPLISVPLSIYYLLNYVAVSRLEGEHRNYDFHVVIPDLEGPRLLELLADKNVVIGVRADQPPLWLQTLAGFLPWLLIIGFLSGPAGLCENTWAVASAGCTVSVNPGPGGTKPVLMACFSAT
jgi:hypothetical protein